MKNNIFLFAFICTAFTCITNAQSLLNTLDKEQINTPQYEIATFKATRIAIGQSIENRAKGVLQLGTLNRFWNLPDTNIQSFVADRWSSQFNVEYGISDRFTAGASWTTFENTFDGYLKHNLIKQLKNRKQPLSVSLFQQSSYTHPDSRFNGKGTFDSFENRFGFTSQLLIARKFDSNFSAQISPTYIHTSYALPKDPKNQFAVGFGGRYKVKPHVSIVSEYYYVANPLKSADTYGAFALGVNWDVRYLLLQFQMTNALSMTTDRFITQTKKNFNTNDGNFFFGFNAIFTIHTQEKKL